MTTNNIYGSIINYSTGVSLRHATREEWVRARDIGDPHTGAHLDTDGATTVYCDGPDEDPDSEAAAAADEALKVREDEAGPATATAKKHKYFVSLTLDQRAVERHREGKERLPEPPGSLGANLFDSLDLALVAAARLARTRESDVFVIPVFIGVYGNCGDPASFRKWELALRVAPHTLSDGTCPWG